MLTLFLCPFKDLGLRQTSREGWGGSGGVHKLKQSTSHGFEGLVFGLTKRWGRKPPLDPWVNVYRLRYQPRASTSLCKPYRYVPPQRVCFLRLFGLKTGVDFVHCGLETGMAFEGTTGVYERICRFNSKWMRKTEQYENSKWILRNLFCWRNCNLSTWWHNFYLWSLKSDMYLRG